MEGEKKVNISCLFLLNSTICSAIIPFVAKRTTVSMRYILKCLNSKEYGFMAISDIGKNAREVLTRRYLGKDENGMVTEDLEGMFRRVSDAVASADRNFDETDSKPLFSDLHFAVLTSRGSFSAANALTAYCKDNGIMVIGEKTGGGACGISFKSTADGLEYMMSSYLVLADRNTDNGIEPDVVLPVNNTDGEKDYSEFYNIERLSMEMNSYYSGANSQ